MEQQEKDGKFSTKNSKLTNKIKVLSYIERRYKMGLTTETSKALQLINSYPDEKRLYLVAESKDWEERIVPSIVEWATLLESGSLPPEQAMVVLRVLIECIYVMGYERGKREEKIGNNWTVFKITQ